MSVIVLADLRGKAGFVNKDTVAGGYGSRFEGFSVATRFAKNLRHVFQNVPSIHIGYLAAIFAQAGHQVIITRDDKEVQGDAALVLTSLVDYKHEREWAQNARARGMRVGFFGLPVVPAQRRRSKRCNFPFTRASARLTQNACCKSCASWLRIQLRRRVNKANVLQRCPTPLRFRRMKDASANHTRLHATFFCTLPFCL